MTKRSGKNKRLAALLREARLAAAVPELPAIHPSELRLDSRAVSERWPVPREERERMVVDAYSVSQDPNQQAKNRLVAGELLVRMDRANVAVNELPDQLEVDAADALSLQQALRELRSNPDMVAALDFRPVRDVDYAD